MAALDLTGQVFGRLIPIRPTNKRNSSGSIMWECECQCKLKKTILASTSNLRKGATRSCGCLVKEACSKNLHKAQQSRKLPEGHAARNNFLSLYKIGARRKNLEWTLTDERAFILAEQNCYYCGEPPSQVIKPKYANGKYIHNGIDRVDSSKGYIENNCVPCCKTCNWAKRAMTQKDFYDWIARVSNFQRLKFLRS